MTNVKLKAALPKDEEMNGLSDDVRRDILADLSKPIVAICVMQPEEVTKSLANGVEVPKLQMIRIERVSDPEEADHLVKRAMVLSEQRTGNTPLQLVPGDGDDDEGDPLGFDDDPEDAA